MRALAVALVAIILVGCAPARHAPYPPEYSPNPSDYGSEPHGWARIADGPLSARHDATAVSIGGRYLVIGGVAARRSCATTECKSDAGRPLRDGAAYDPATDRWSLIADAPTPVATSDYAVFDSDVYFLSTGQTTSGGRQFLRYEPDANHWTRLPAPPSRPGHLLAEPGSLVDVADSSTGAGPTEYFFTANANRWAPGRSPIDPIGSSHNRRLFWADGDLVLFAQPGPVSGPTSTVRSTRIWSSRGWSQPTDLNLVSSDPVLVNSTTFVFPDRGTRIGPDGKQHPAGGILTSQQPAPLPRTTLQPMTEAGIEQTQVLGDSVLHDGLLLDLRAGTYRRPPAFIGASRDDAASAAGEELFLWGGTSRRTGHDLKDGYLLYP